MERQEVKVGVLRRFPFYSDVAHWIAAVIPRSASMRVQMQIDCISLRQSVTLSEISAVFRLCGEVIHRPRM